ncbi:MAG: SDR family NAD(P)-dependent oxidoreductase [Myxococcota bacterium]
MAKLKGRVAVVTGAASGIGAATARRLAMEGASVVLGDVQAEPLAELTKALQSSGAAADCQPCDVAEISQVEALFELAMTRHGRLDIAFNNAGTGALALTPDMEPELWHRLVRVNLDSVYYGCRAAIRHMRKTGGGSIINTASISGLGGDYGLGVYNATKGAVVNYTRSVALDHGREGIRVNAVCPGAIATGLTRGLYKVPKVIEAFEEAIPMGRVGQAEEVAAAVSFLASDDASYITGAMLVIDGGLTAATGAPSYTRLLGVV